MVRSPDLRTHVRWLLDQLEGKEAAVAEILESGVKGDVFCFVTGNRARGEMDGETRERLERFGLELSIDYYED